MLPFPEAVVKDEAAEETVVGEDAARAVETSIRRLMNQRRQQPVVQCINVIKEMPFIVLSLNSALGGILLSQKIETVRLKIKISKI